MDEQSTAIAVVEHGISPQRPPKEVLDAAQEAAKALTNVLKNKRNPVKFGGEQYLEFEDWQTVARFYQLTVKVVSTNLIEIDEIKGFEAKAVVIDNRSGMEISAAESMCMNDEKNWKMKPFFQLRSMAQTRACAKALRNVLAWVVVLAGYKPTPAEEMSEVNNHQQIQTIQVDEEPEEPKATKTSNAPLSDDQLGNFVMPKGKYAGQRLMQIVGQESENGKKVGLEYLEWCADNLKTATYRGIIQRFLETVVYA